MDTRLNSEQLLTPVNNALSAEEKQCVYRFKAALKYRKGLWRRIEIQGGQTLADFKNILVHTFKHDDGHLSGFRKRVRRGNTKRYREIELGHIDPLGHGSGADILIAQLELQPGNVLKFIYDFGDWIEHTLTLEAITAPEKEPFPDKRAFPEKGGQYPRITAQNRPRYRYCQTCKDEGRQTVATWVCLECPDNEDREIWVCEDCLDKHHEDHYADEIRY